MLSPEQEQWVSQLSDKPIVVVPYDPRSDRLFAVTKLKIISALGPDVVVEHCGASALGISGQDEVDVTIVAEQSKFDEYIAKLQTVFGPPKKRYPDRVRFEVREEGKKIDLKISDKNHPNHLNGKKFESYMHRHPEELERYRMLKESLSGMITREYYRKKIEYINEILSRTD